MPLHVSFLCWWLGYAFCRIDSRRTSRHRRRRCCGHAGVRASTAAAPTPARKQARTPASPRGSRWGSSTRWRRCAQAAVGGGAAEAGCSRTTTPGRCSGTLWDPGAVREDHVPVPRRVHDRYEMNHSISTRPQRNYDVCIYISSGLQNCAIRSLPSRAISPFQLAL